MVGPAVKSSRWNEDVSACEPHVSLLLRNATRGYMLIMSCPLHLIGFCSASVVTFRLGLALLAPYVFAFVYCWFLIIYIRDEKKKKRWKRQVSHVKEQFPMNVICHLSNIDILGF